MFKGFQDTSKSSQFRGFPNLNHQMNNSAYGFSGCTFWLDAASGLNTQADLAAVSKFVEKLKRVSFEQATAGNQPRLVAADSNFNNLPSIQRQSNARFLFSSVSVPMATRFTLVYVGKKDTGVSSNSVLEDNPTGGSGLGEVILSLSPISSGAFVSGSTQIVTAINDTLPHIIIMTNTEIYVDGVLAGSGSLISSRSINTIGRNGTGNNDVGRTAEVLLFNQALIGADCVRLSANINSKYAIY